MLKKVNLGYGNLRIIKIKIYVCYQFKIVKLMKFIFQITHLVSFKMHCVPIVLQNNDNQFEIIKLPTITEPMNILFNIKLFHVSP